MLDILFSLFAFLFPADAAAASTSTDVEANAEKIARFNVEMYVEKMTFD